MNGKWHHGHSMGAGVVGGLLLTTHMWLLVVVSIAFGFALRELYDAARWAARTIAKWSDRPSAIYVPSWAKRRDDARAARKARAAAATPTDLPEGY